MPLQVYVAVRMHGQIIAQIAHVTQRSAVPARDYRRERSSCIGLSACPMSGWLSYCWPVEHAIGLLVGSSKRFMLDESLLLTGLVPAKRCSQLI